MKKAAFILLGSIGFSFYVNAQIPTLDSLHALPFEELEKEFRDLSKQDQSLFLKHYLTLAQKEKDSMKIVAGLFLKALENSHAEESLIYLDSVLVLTNSWKHKLFPGFGYLEKGIQLYYLGQHEEALEFYLKAQSFFSNDKDEYNLLRVRHYVALLKNVTDQHYEALTIFKKNMLFFNKENKEKYSDQYFKSLFALADSYNRNEQYSYAEQINIKGIKESYFFNSKMYPHFLLSFGTSKILNNQPSKGVDSIIKGGKLIQNKKGALCASYLKLSEAYLKLNQTKLSEKYLLKIDSIYKKHDNVINYAYTAYSNLYKIYNSNKDDEKQLWVIKKLLEIDNQLEEKKLTLSNRIIREYETKELLSERNKIISQLSKKTSNNQRIIFGLSLLSFFFSLVVIYLVRRNRKNQYRFNQLMQKETKKDSNLAEGIVKIKEGKKLDIPEEIIKTIGVKLAAFEKSNRYIKKQYTLASLAKEFKTNTSYLSKIINHIKGLNFSNYLNELKISYIIEELKVNPEYEKYSIEGIAKAAGFNSSESFNRAFYKKTGIYPSYFIKQLIKKRITSTTK